jgi:beta-N-acetylhexosaminidase
MFCTAPRRVSLIAATALLTASAGAVTVADRPAHAQAESPPPRIAHVSGAQPTAGSLPLDRAIGQLVIGTWNGTSPSAGMLAAVRNGDIGGVIVMGDNLTSGAGVARSAIRALQNAAQAGHNPALLVMTDQEGGEVKRLPGAPQYPASKMSDPTVAAAQGRATARLLKSVGVNVDLAPVADVTRTDGFMTQESRTFGNSPAAVARAACAFANGLQSQGVAYTLKHFPGLGDAVATTDTQPVTVSESAAEIHADGAAYRLCGSGRLALVMISSASYTNLTGRTPAVMSPRTYTALADDGVTALPISDSLQAGALEHINSPARKAISAGLDMAMYTGMATAALHSYSILLADARAGQLGRARVYAAASRVLLLKRRLGIDRTP